MEFSPFAHSPARRTGEGAASARFYRRMKAQQQAPVSSSLRYGRPAGARRTGHRGPFQAQLAPLQDSRRLPHWSQEHAPGCRRNAGKAGRHVGRALWLRRRQLTSRQTLGRLGAPSLGPSSGFRLCTRQDVEAQLGKPVTAPSCPTREVSMGEAEPLSVGPPASNFDSGPATGPYPLRSGACLFVLQLAPEATGRPEPGRLSSPSRYPCSGPRTVPGGADAREAGSLASRRSSPRSRHPAAARWQEPGPLRLYCRMLRPGPESGARGGESSGEAAECHRNFRISN